MTQAGAKVLDYVYPGTDQAKAADAVTAAIDANPDLAGVYATHEIGRQRRGLGHQGGGPAGTIKLVAFDSAPNQVADLKTGVYDALIAQAPFNMGYYSVKLVADAIRGNVDTSTVEHDNPTGLYAITKENADAPETQPWIYPADLNACPTAPLWRPSAQRLTHRAPGAAAASGRFVVPARLFALRFGACFAP